MDRHQTDAAEQAARRWRVNGTFQKVGDAIGASFGDSGLTARLAESSA
jgi:hypothetical protein